MSQAAATDKRARTPWHLWVIGGFFLLLSLAGVRDYVLCLTLNQGYFDAQGYGPPVVEYFTQYPLIPKIFWTITMTASVLAALLLLLRSARCVPVALVSAVANLCLAGWTFSLRDRWQIFGPTISLFDLGIMLMLCTFWWYCRTMHTHGFLR